MPIRTVNPGDLINASGWNELVAALNNLEVRVADLETGGDGGGLRITQVLPPGMITVGDTIRISGSGFDFTKGAHSVFFGSTRAINFAPDSNDNLLVVEVPDPVAGATVAGTPITMTVGNLTDFVTWPLTIRAKPEVVAGGIQFSYKGSQPTTPTQNTTVFYDFELKSFASTDLTVLITPTIQVIPPLPSGVSDPGLPGLLAVVDSDGTVRSDRQIALAEGATKTIRLRLNLPNNVNGLKYSLSATASATGIAAVTESVPAQEVGQAGEQPDPTITNFEFSAFIDGQGSFSTDTGGVSGADGTIRVKRNTTATVEMRTQFAGIPAGTTNNYQVTATVDSPANGWSAAVNPVMQNPLAITGPGGLVSVFFDLTAPNSTATAVVRFTLTRQGISTGNTRKAAYRLQTQP